MTMARNEFGVYGVVMAPGHESKNRKRGDRAIASGENGRGHALPLLMVGESSYIVGLRQARSDRADLGMLPILQIGVSIHAVFRRFGIDVSVQYTVREQRRIVLPSAGVLLQFVSPVPS